MKHFQKLNFGPHPLSDAGTQATIFFDNNYGVSVITGPFAETAEGMPSFAKSPLELYELAVLTKDGCVTYDTPITDGTIGFLTAEAVDDLLDQISKLPHASKNT